MRQPIAPAETAILKEPKQPFDGDNDGDGDVDIEDVSDALATVNENFDEGTDNEGNLKEP